MHRHAAIPYIRSTTNTPGMSGMGGPRGSSSNYGNATATGYGTGQGGGNHTTSTAANMATAAAASLALPAAAASLLGARGTAQLRGIALVVSGDFGTRTVFRHPVPPTNV